MHYEVQEGFRMKNRMGSSEAVSKARGGGSREAIVEAAERLFLDRGFGAVTMDELAEAAGVARRTLYNQFASKEEIFREMLLRVSGQLETAFPPGIETRGEVEEVLRLVARMILGLHKNPEYLGFLRMVVADSNRDSVGCEHRFAPVSGSRPQASLKAGSARKASRSSASSYPQAIAKMRARTMSASVCVMRSGSRRSGKHRANLSAIPNRRSAIASSITPPSEVSRPPSKAAATGLRPTAGNENGSRLELVMASGCWGARRNGSV